jgi:hypothetical protein
VKRAVGTLALGVATVIAVMGLADATQDRRDGPNPGTRSEVVLDVETRDGFERDVAAHGLWATCQQTVENKRVESFEALGDGRFAIVVEPAIGENAKRRLVGCLEDFTIDRVLGNVVEIRDLEPEPKPAR